MKQKLKCLKIEMFRRLYVNFLINNFYIDNMLKYFIYNSLNKNIVVLKLTLFSFVSF